MIILGGALCLVAWLLGRLLARTVLRIAGAPLLSRQADGRYARNPPARRAMFRLAGPLAAYLLAAVLGFTAMRALGDHVSTMTIDVVPGGPADTAGLRSGDRIVTIDGVAPSTWDDVLARVRAGGAGRPTSIRAQRDDGPHVFDVMPDAQGRIRVMSRPQRIERPLGPTLAQGAAWPVATLARQMRDMIATVTGRQRVSLQGPVAIVREVESTGDHGQPLGALLLLLASAAGLVWPLSVILEVMFAPRRPRTSP
jgi:membrane-associated protease RseP (regulator of RpoE activity)